VEQLNCSIGSRARFRGKNNAREGMTENSPGIHAWVLTFQGIKSRRDGRGFLSSLRDLLPWIHANRALKRWTIFFRGQSPLQCLATGMVAKMRVRLADACAVAAMPVQTPGPSLPINLCGGDACSSRRPRRPRSTHDAGCANTTQPALVGSASIRALLSRHRINGITPKSFRTGFGIILLIMTILLILSSTSPS
jgi:hypothetical protein